MSAPIHSLLADELDLPDAQAKKLLGAMLREIRKRARSRGVRLPELGKFREKNGTLVFEPSDSLARAVNHRFEGLDSEDLGSAPEQPDEDDAESDEGPSTITLGYQESSNWSPIDAEDEPSESKSEDDEPDTAEFEVPSADDAADTDELQATDASAQASSSQHTDSSQRSPAEPSPSAREPSPEPESASETEAEELYPLVEDGPEESDEEASSSPSPPSSSGSDEEEYDRERDTLSDIWGESDDDSETDEGSSSFESDTDAATGSSSFEEMDPFGETEETSEQPPETEYLDQEPISTPEDTSSAPEPEPDPTEPEAPQHEEPPPQDSSTEETAPEPAEKKKSTTLRVLATLLILILVGGSAWYILGQRGMAPRPGTTFAQLKTQVQALPIVGSTDQSEATASSSSTSSATGSTSDSASDSQSSGSSATSDPASETTESSEASSDPAATTTTTSGGSSQNIDPAAGGWTIVVASRTNQSSAQTVVNDFRQRFSDQQVPIDVVAGNVENTTRYRVGVGQFESRDAAQQFLDEYSSELPDGAWSLRLQ